MQIFSIQTLYTLLLIIPLIAIFFLISCRNTGSGKPRKGIPVGYVKHPEWSKNANIYEVNIRQYTPEGTFTAFEKHLPRLKEMGVDILWFMPVHPIGEKNRKGTLGSYYSVKDYKAVNPEFGTLDDFKSVVEEAHALGMYVIIDWVANHTAWDNPWIYEHPGWYTKDSAGNFVSPFDWSDVVDLDFDNKELWKAMQDALDYWVTEADIDGYRCDVAGMVPVEFWNETRMRLDKIKPVFMLAEAEEPEHHLYAFDMSYGWEFHHIMNQIANGKMNANAIDSYFKKQDTLYPANAYRMYFTSNHDENSWNGTEFERMGDGARTFALLSATIPGMPLIYSGQEAAFNKRLEFFEKDQIEWDDYPYQDFYSSLLKLKHQNQALWNGDSGGTSQRIKTSDNKSVYAFIREKEGNKILILLNLSGKNVETTLKGTKFIGNSKEWFTGEHKTLNKNESILLEPWGYLVFVSVETQNIASLLVILSKVRVDINFPLRDFKHQLVRIIQKFNVIIRIGVFDSFFQPSFIVEVISFVKQFFLSFHINAGGVYIKCDII